MLPKVIAKSDFQRFAEKLLARFRVGGPIEHEPGRFAFEDIIEPSELRLDYPTCMLPPKKYLMPQWETLIRFKRGEVASAEAVVDVTPQVLLGVHPCDIYGIWLLDTVFADTVPDPHYLERRKNTVIVGLDCLKPCDDYQLCLDTGSVNAKQGFDLLLTDLGDAYYVEVASEKGSDLLEQFAAGTHRPNASEMEAYRKAMDAKQASFRHRLPFDIQHLPEILDEAYDSLVWQAVARNCVSCGACNLLCPTCYCFNVVEHLKLNLAEGERKRHWDSCQLREFATVAGGESFRKERSDRLRHRFFRKGKFIFEKFGKLGCTGCGRCARHCPADISLIDTYTQIAGSNTR